MVPKEGRPVVWAEATKLARGGWLTPIAKIRSAPSCTAEDKGEIWRIEPSPKNSMPPSTQRGVDGKMKGMALDAIRCSMVMGCCSARRPGRLHVMGWPSRVWQNVQ